MPKPRSTSSKPKSSSTKSASPSAKGVSVTTPSDVSDFRDMICDTETRLEEIESLSDSLASALEKGAASFDLRDATSSESIKSLRLVLLSLYSSLISQIHSMRLHGKSIEHSPLVNHLITCNLYLDRLRQLDAAEAKSFRVNLDVSADGAPAGGPDLQALLGGVRLQVSKAEAAPASPSEDRTLDTDEVEEQPALADSSRSSRRTSAMSTSDKAALADSSRSSRRTSAMSTSDKAVSLNKSDKGSAVNVAPSLIDDSDEFGLCSGFRRRSSNGQTNGTAAPPGAVDDPDDFDDGDSPFDDGSDVDMGSGLDSLEGATDEVLALMKEAGVNPDELPEYDLPDDAFDVPTVATESSRGTSTPRYPGARQATTEEDILAAMEMSGGPALRSRRQRADSAPVPAPAASEAVPKVRSAKTAKVSANRKITRPGESSSASASGPARKLARKD